MNYSHIFLAFCSVILFCSSACVSLKAPEFAGLDSYKFNKSNPKDIELQMNLKVKNPNKTNIKVKKYMLNVSVNGTSIGKAQSKGPVVLPKNSEGSYPFYLHTNLENIMAQVFPGLSAIISQKPIELKLDGYIKGGAYGVSKKFPISITRPLEMKQLMKMKE